jgi:hypothetical protein
VGDVLAEVLAGVVDRFAGVGLGGEVDDFGDAVAGDDFADGGGFLNAGDVGGAKRAAQRWPVLRLSSATGV